MHWAALGLVPMRVVSGLHRWAGIKKGDLESQHSAAVLGQSEAGPLEWCWHAVLGRCSLSSDSRCVWDEISVLDYDGPDLGYMDRLVCHLSPICILTTGRDRTSGGRCPAGCVSLLIGTQGSNSTSFIGYTSHVRESCEVVMLLALRGLETNYYIKELFRPLCFLVSDQRGSGALLD